MRRRDFLHGVLLALLLGLGATSFAADSAYDWNGEWMGQMVSKSQTSATAPYAHVTLKAMGSRLSGTWGKYALTGSMEEGHVELTLTDDKGAMVAEMRGAVGNDLLYGTGSVDPTLKGGAQPDSSAAQEWNAVSWSLRRAGTRQ
jgi:hypothetical protein